MSAASTGPARKPAVSVIIVAYNSGRYLKGCLAGLAAQEFRDFEILIFDNSSSDGSIEALGALPPATRVIRSPDNLGFAAGNNRAAQQVQADWIALLNPDTVPAPGWLAELMAAQRRYPDCPMFGSTQVSLEKPDRLDGVGDCYHWLGFYWRGGYGHLLPAPPGDAETFSPCAAAALYRRSVFLEAGGFDERFFCYGEDVDLAFRLRLAGHRAIQVAKACIHHAGSGIAGLASPFTLYHGWRNRIWVLVKNMPGPIFWAIFPLHLIATSILLLRHLDQPSIVWPMARGVWAGLKGLGPILGERRKIQRGRRVGLAALWPILSLSLTAIHYYRPIHRRLDRA